MQPLFARCPTCNKFDWIDKHRCPPRWAIYRADDPSSEPSIMFGTTATDAAEQYTAEHDAGDYHLMNGDELMLIVVPYGAQQDQDFATEAETVTWLQQQPHYLCKGYMVPEYTATLQKTATAPSQKRPPSVE